MQLFILFFVVMMLVLILHNLWSANTKMNVRFSALSLTYFSFIYLNIAIGFGLIYTIMFMNGWEVFHVTTEKMTFTYFHVLEKSMYFSAITLFGVGYGDIVPIGIGKWIAVCEALIGFTMPATFFMQTIVKMK